MEHKSIAELHQVRQQPVTPTAKGKKLDGITPGDKQMLLDFGITEAELYTEDELLDIGFIKRGVLGEDGQLHDS